MSFVATGIQVSHGKFCAMSYSHCRQRIRLCPCSAQYINNLMARISSCLLFGPGNRLLRLLPIECFFR